MASDLHYTPDEVARLRDEATPGPWRGDRNDGSVKYAIRGGDGRLVLTCDHKSGRYGFVVGDEWGDDEIGGEHDGDERLTLAAPSLADDLLTLHDEVAALREQADRMRAVLLALADGFDAADRHDDREDYDAAIQAIFDSATTALGEARDGTLREVSTALRTLAGEASR